MATAKNASKTVSKPKAPAGKPDGTIVPHPGDVPASKPEPVADKPKRAPSNQAMMVATARLAHSLTGLDQDVPNTVGLAISAAQLSIITQNTDPRYIRERRGRGSGTFRYVDGPYVIERLNLAFGWNWDFDVVDKGQVVINGQIQEVWVQGRLTVRTPTQQVLTKTQFGTQAVEYLTAQGKTDIPVSIGDAYKGASTDALKKAASLLGLALDLYDNDGDIGNERAAFQSRQETAAPPAGPVMENKPKAEPKVDPAVQARVEQELAERTRLANAGPARPTADWDAPDEAVAEAAIEMAKRESEAAGLRAKAQQNAEDGDPETASQLSVEADLAAAGLPMTQPKEHPDGEVYQIGVLSYKNDKGIQLVECGKGNWKPALAKVGALKKESYANLVKLLDAEKHLKNHMHQWFGVDLVPELTWEMMAAMLIGNKDGRWDPRWYAQKIHDLAQAKAKKDAKVSPEAKAMVEAFHLPGGLEDPLLPELLQLDDPYRLTELYGEAGADGIGRSWDYEADYPNLVGLVTLLRTGQVTIGSPNFILAIDSVHPAHAA